MIWMIVFYGTSIWLLLLMMRWRCRWRWRGKPLKGNGRDCKPEEMAESRIWFAWFGFTHCSLIKYYFVLVNIECCSCDVQCINCALYCALLINENNNDVCFLFFFLDVLFALRKEILSKNCHNGQRSTVCPFLSLPSQYEPPNHQRQASKPLSPVSGLSDTACANDVPILKHPPTSASCLNPPL